MLKCGCIIIAQLLTHESQILRPGFFSHGLAFFPHGSLSCFFMLFFKNLGPDINGSATHLPYRQVLNGHFCLLALPIHAGSKFHWLGDSVPCLPLGLEDSYFLPISHSMRNVLLDISTQAGFHFPFPGSFLQTLSPCHLWLYHRCFNAVLIKANRTACSIVDPQKHVAMKNRWFSFIETK